MRRPIARYGLCVGRWDRWCRLNARTGVSGDMSRICACIAWAPGWVVTIQVDRSRSVALACASTHVTHVVVLPIEKKSQFQTPDAPAIHEFDTGPDGVALLLLTRRVKSARVYAEIDWSLLLMFAGRLQHRARTRRIGVGQDLSAG
jgi:di/tricarboxylate transporter